MAMKSLVYLQNAGIQSLVATLFIFSATLSQPRPALAISHQIQPTTIEFSAAGTDGNKVTFGGGAQDGAYNYSFPIEVPPGRNEFQPAISLQYRSTGEVYGGLAQGWTLPVPLIRVDTSSSQLGRESSPVYLGLNGERLVQVTKLPGGEGVYRARHDSSNALYVRGKASQAFEWEVRFPDGSTQVFGRKSGPHFTAEDAQTHLIAPLWKHSDRWGNRIEYDFVWSRVTGATATHTNVTGGSVASGSLNPPPAIERFPAFEYQLREIRYGMSSGGAETVVNPVASVVFNWDESGQPGCTEPGNNSDAIKTPIGAKYSYRTGQLMVTGAHQLDRITTFALRPDENPDTAALTMREVKEYELKYDENASNCRALGGAPRRLLSRIRERGYHLDGSPGAWLEPTTFSYGKHYETRWETHEILPAGDSIYEIDHAFTNEAGGRRSMAKAEWGEAFKVSGGLGGHARIPLPYDNERTKLLDIDSDGRPDLVKAVVVSVPNTSGVASARCAAQWHRNTGTGFSTAVSGTIALPTIPWMNSTANHYGSIGGGEFCGLNLQSSGLLDTAIEDYEDGFSCTDEHPRSGKILPTWQTTKVLANYAWEDHDHDGDLDLVVGVNHAPTLSSDYAFFARDDRFSIDYNTYTDTSSDLGEFPAYIEQALNLGDNLPSDENDPYYHAPSSKTDLHRNEICEVMPDFQGGGYPWLVLKNDGRGNFSNSPDIKRMPVPLSLPRIPVTWMEDLVYSSGLGDWINNTLQSLQTAGAGDGGGSSDYQVSLSSNVPSLVINRVDVNGDGYLDLVESSVKKISRNSRQWIMGLNDTGESYDVEHDWRVLLGDKSGGFRAAPDNKAYVMYTPGLRDGGFYSALRVPVTPMNLGGETTGYYAINDIPDLNAVANYFNYKIGPHDVHGVPIVFGAADCENVNPASEVDYSAVDSWLDLNGDGLSDKVQSANGCITPVSIASSWNRGNIGGLESSVTESAPRHTQTLYGRGMLGAINANTTISGAHPARMMDVYRESSREVKVTGNSMSGAILDPHSRLWFIAAVRHGRAINLIDIDADGLPDQVRGKDVRYNHSGQHFGENHQGVLSTLEVPAAARSTILKPHIPVNPGIPGSGEQFDHYAMRESLNATLMDFDGNGLIDVVFKKNDNVHSPQSVRLYKQRSTGVAPWLLAEIGHPTGASTKIRYANARNDRNTVLGANRKRIGPSFVVKSVTVDPGQVSGFSVPAMTENYAYADPVFNFDHEDRHKFAGYKRIFTSRQDENGNASLLEKHWSFDLWHTGLLTEERLRDSAGYYHTISQFSYLKQVPMGEDDFSVYVQDISHEYRCAAQQPYRDCLKEGVHISRQSVHKGYGSMGNKAPLLFTLSEIREYDERYQAQMLPLNEHGNRREVQEYHLHFSLAGGYYRLLPTIKTHYVVEVDPDECSGELCNAIERMINEERLEYNAAYLAPVKQSQRIDDTNEWAVTEYRYTATGQIRQVRTPAQSAVGAGGKWKRFKYDVRQMYPVITYNELNHQQRIRTWDYGFGVALLNEGPSYKCADYSVSNTQGGCNDNPNVNSDAYRHYLPRKVVLDEFGRVIEEWIGRDDPGESHLYELMKVSDTTYYDHNHLNNALNGYTTRKLEDHPHWPADGTTGVSVFSYYIDGLGRKLKDQVKNSDYSNIGAADTFYLYDQLGRLTGIRTMNPAHEELSRTGDEPLYVHYTARYDIFDRVISTRLPDVHTGGAGNTGIDTVYHSAWKIEIRETDNDSGPASVKFQHYDRFGKLIKLEERKSDAEGMLTTAEYEYDARGTLKRIRSGDNIETVIVSDWLARPQTITRADKHWVYHYDDNSNVTAIEYPRPAGASPTLYRADYRYDALNRITRRTPPRSNLTADQRQAWMTGTVTYHYDEDTNAQGQQNRVRNNLYEVSQKLDAVGRVTSTTQAINVDGFENDPLTIESTYRGTRLVLQAEADHLEVDGQLDRTFLMFQYDNGGNIQSIRSGSGSYQNGFTSYNLAEVTRNAAGRIIQRRSGHASSGQDFALAPLQVFWEYDKQGKFKQVDAHHFDSASGALARRTSYSAGYYRNGDANSIYHEFDGEAVEFSFRYDDRHMLTETHTGEDGPYRSWFTYSAGGRLQGARVTLPSTAVSGYSRDVQYVYDSVDPAELKTLANQDDASDFSRYDYDAAGNMTGRNVVGQAHHRLFYDGDNRLREIVHLDSGEFERFFYHGPERILAIRHDTDGKRISSRRWFGNSEIRYDANGNKTTTLVRVELGQTIARIRDRQQVDYQIHSPQEHLLLAMDAHGNINGGATYGPFGEMIEKAGNLSDYTRGFNNKDFDANSNLHYYGHRYYDPVALIWNRPDPKYSVPHAPSESNPLEANLYTFTRNNPVSFIDPDGLEVFLFGIGGDANTSLAMDVAGAAASGQQLSGFLAAGRALGVVGAAATLGFSVGSAADKIFGISDGISDALVRDNLMKQMNRNAQEIHFAQVFTQKVYASAKEQGEAAFGRRPLFVRIPPGVHKQIEKAAARYNKLRKRCRSSQCRNRAWERSFKDVDLGKIKIEIDEYEDAKEQKILENLRAMEEAKIIDQSMISEGTLADETESLPHDPIGAAFDEQ